MANDNDVVLSAKADLASILASVQKLQDKLNETSETFGKTGKKVDEGFNDNVKSAEGFVGKLSALSRRIGDQLKEDFRSLASLKSLTAGLAISNQFSGSLKETIGLSDAIRKLGESFGVAEKDFSTFQTALTKGMGDIGMSSEEAASTLKGLAGQGITGQGTVTKYAQTAAQLASLGGEKGQGGAVGAGLANVVRAKGGNVQDVAQLDEVARAVTQAMGATGKGASELLHNMEEAFKAMDPEMRKNVNAKGLTQAAVAGTVAGPGMGELVKMLTSLPKELRPKLEAFGLDKLMGKNGQLNMGALDDVKKKMQEIGVSTGMAAKIVTGGNDQAADALVRLIDGADRVKEALDRSAKVSDDYAGKARKNMGMQESFQASINKVKSIMGGPLSEATQSVTDLLGKASESKGGAVATVAGAGVLAAVLAGGGLKGIGKGMGIGGMVKGEAMKQAREGLTGEKEQRVFVTNFADMPTGAAGGLGGAASAMGGMGGKILKGAGIVGAVATVAEVGNEYLSQKAEGGVAGLGEDATKWDALFAKMDKFFNTERGQQLQKAQKVIVELNRKELKESRPGSRGSAQ